jgi:hypothetical protein
MHYMPYGIVKKLKERGWEEVSLGGNGDRKLLGFDNMMILDNGISSMPEKDRWLEIIYKPDRSLDLQLGWATKENPIKLHIHVAQSGNQVFSFSDKRLKFHLRNERTAMEIVEVMKMYRIPYVINDRRPEKLLLRAEALQKRAENAREEAKSLDEEVRELHEKAKKAEEKAQQLREEAAACTS